MMQTSAMDYRTATGVSRRLNSESVLDKYIRVARVEAPHLYQTYPLPIARPEVVCALSFADYGLLLDVLDELFVLEAAARYADRKAADIARRRLYGALSVTVGYEARRIERLFEKVDRLDVPVLRAVARAILPKREIVSEIAGAPVSSATVIQFPRT